jgi:hypothetical protein
MASSGGVPIRLVGSIKDPSAPFDSIVKANDYQSTSVPAYRNPDGKVPTVTVLDQNSAVQRVGKLASAAMGDDGP